MTSRELVDMIRVALMETLALRRWVEEIHVVRPGAPEVWEFVKDGLDGGIISIAVRDRGPSGHSLRVETEGRAGVFDEVVSEAIGRTVKHVRDTLLRSVNRPTLLRRVREALQGLK